MCLVIQSCPTLCNPMDGSLPGSSVHGDSSGMGSSKIYLSYSNEDTDIENMFVDTAGEGEDGMN